MKRYPDWPQRLFTFIESRRQAVFSWGANDCCLFCADAVKAITGVDPAARFRGAYSDEAGALALLEAHGGLEALVTSILGEPKGPLCGRQGDIALVPTRKGHCVGVIEGNHVVCVGDTEQILFKLSTALKSWQVA